MKRGLMKGLIALILILFGNLAIFLLFKEFVASFWICYAFSMIAALITAYVEIVYAEKEVLIFRYPISIITFLYLVIELVVSIILFKCFKSHVLLLFLVQLFILGSYLIMLLSALIHNSTTKEQQQLRGRDIANFRVILNNMNSIVSKTDYADPNRKLLQHAYDSLASGQIKSSEAAQRIELEILDLIQFLDDAVLNKEQEKITDLCNKLEKAAEERKRVLNSSKLS